MTVAEEDRISRELTVAEEDRISRETQIIFDVFSLPSCEYRESRDRGLFCLSRLHFVGVDTCIECWSREARKNRAKGQVSTMSENGPPREVKKQ